LKTLGKLVETGCRVVLGGGRGTDFSSFQHRLLMPRRKH
jgi:hypothetical protein